MYVRLLAGDAEPVCFEPAAVVALPRTGAEEADLGANPFAYLGGEGFADRLVFLAVEAVIEGAYALVVSFWVGFLAPACSNFTRR